MKCAKVIISLLLMTSWTTLPLLAGEELDGVSHPNSYMPTHQDVRKHKDQYDDPRPYLKELALKQVLPPDIYQKLTFDTTEMKEKWAEVVGFRSPDVVGKIAPEVTPGKYSYKDKEKYPGLKDLMWADMYNRIAPGGPPLVGNIPEFEVVPTKQYYFASPIAEATLGNAGKTKLDENGYAEWDTWEAGYPFPKPSGEFKAQQIMYNVERRYIDNEGNSCIVGWNNGFNKNLRSDLFSPYTGVQLRLAGRCLIPPYGWFDNRAQERREYRAFVMTFHGPRDIAGTVLQACYFINPDQMDQNMMFIPSLRRIRKMSATDTQDPVMGSDVIYDDTTGFAQKLSPKRYPFKYKVIEEREYLYPAYTEDGAEYVTSEKQEFRNMKFERRPLYVVELTQLDPNYIYAKRIIFVDKESFCFPHLDNYDQKGRLYRTYDTIFSFYPEMGMFYAFGGLVLMTDHIDSHSSWHQCYQIPAYWGRGDVNLAALAKRGK